MEATNTATSVYHFDDVTGVYTGVGDALVGPAGDLQVPAFALLTEPPVAADGYVACAVVDAAGAVSWSTARDYRAVDVYRTSDGAQVRIGDEIDGDKVWTGLGELPDTLTSTARPSAAYTWQAGAWVVDLTKAKAAKLSAINAERGLRQAGQFAFQGKQFTADAETIARVTSATSLASLSKAAGSTYSIDLPDATGTDVTLDGDTVLALAAALTAAVSQVFDTARKLKADIDAATSAAELDAIEWPATA